MKIVRVVIVSSHYPPDFTSGGTLVPQRHARALRARGHDVRVYAGSLSASVPHDEVDETGLPVRWFPVNDATAWSDQRNTANGAAAADFAQWLQQVRPEVVHLHSLQAMGGELVAIAKRSGARTVVTMHDFWWSCARQFLVDKQFRPCSLVVDAGVCGCEVDRPWLDARNAQLEERVGSGGCGLCSLPNRRGGRRSQRTGGRRRGRRERPAAAARRPRHDLG